jgi:crotonobetainyl-CoA:carnitine CoA-transferase CaiB-like acyl-CoA transferase
LQIWLRNEEERDRSMGGVLEGVRVLDFGRYIAGPYCATLLAEFGAEVIRVEKRDGSEDRFVAPVGKGGEGALFLQINRNKKCITLDPMKAEGQEVLRRLVARSDVVVANLPPQTLRAMKLDYESLKAIKPDIILTTATAFGGPGPWSDRVGFDGIGQVMSGAVYMTGAGDPPYRAAVPWVDFGTALHCAFGTLAALIERGKSGRGQIVEGALLATALTFTNATLIEQAVIAVNRVPTGNLGQTSAPADIYRTTDGWVLCQVTGQPLFVRWTKLMGEDSWLNDPRFSDDIKRGDNGPLISQRMARWCAERTTQEAVDTLGRAQIPAGPVLSPQQALDHPHIRAAGFMTSVDYPGLPNPAPVARAAVRLSQTPGGIVTRPPTLGEHTDLVLGELGYDAASIAALRKAGAI